MSDPLWNGHGTPLQPHVSCPRGCGADEIGSLYDHAWCCGCGWRGSLTEMRKAHAHGVIEALVGRKL